MVKKILLGLGFFTGLVFAQSSSLTVNNDQIFLKSYAPSNYIKNSGAEKNSTFGTTDSASIVTRNTTTPLSGIADYQITASGANIVKFNGERAIQLGYVGRNCEASFTYTGDASLYTASVYYSTSTLVQGPDTLKNITSGVGRFEAIFPCTNNTYFIQLNSSGAAATIHVDDIYVGPTTQIGQTQQIGDWTSYTPTITGSSSNPTLGNSTIAGKWRRVGDSAEIEIYFLSGSTWTTGSGRIDLSVPFTIDGSKLPGGSATGNVTYGQGLVYSTTTGYPVTVVGSNSTTSVSMQAEASTARSTFSTPFTWASTTANQGINIRFIIPVIGWQNQNAASTSQNLLPTQTRLTSGSGTYTTPPKAIYISVKMVGGGAGGVGSGSAAGTVPTAGGTTTFGSSLLSASGGGIGSWTTGVGGSGGSASGAITSPAFGTAFGGGDGGPQIGQATSSLAPGSMGGASCIAPGPRGGQGNAVGSGGNANSGAGGGGGGISGVTGGYGGPGGGAGACINAFIQNPSATYSYAIGAGGSAGGAGTSGFAGGAGGSGYIEVTEYYSTNAPNLVGSVTSNTSGSERIERATITNNGSTCAVTSQSGSWISSVSRPGSGQCTLTITTGMFSSAPTCTLTSEKSGSSNFCQWNGAVTTTSGPIACATDSGTGIDGVIHVHCMGPR